MVPELLTVPPYVLGTPPMSDCATVHDTDPLNELSVTDADDGVR